MTDQASTKAVLSLVFGILSFVACPCIGGIAAVALGWGEKTGVGRVGLILGWIHLGLCALSLVAYLVIIVVFGGIAAMQH